MPLPQLGYYHDGLGSYVYHEKPHGYMGDLFSDIGNALSTGLQKVETQATTDVNQLLNTAQTATSTALVNTPSGQQAVNQGIAAGIQAYIAKAQANPMTTLAIGGAAIFLLYAIFKPHAQKARDTIVQYLPSMPTYAPPAPAAAAPAKTNPRRYRRKRRK